MNLSDLHRVYFIGIGGIGMSALARYFHHLGKTVAGYDRTRTPLTIQLEEAGIAIDYTASEGRISLEFIQISGTLVVYTPAVPSDLPKLVFFRENQFLIKKRSEVLGSITKDTFCFAAAGTHGKTTTSSILAHMLKEIETPFAAFLGGISEDFNSNFAFYGRKFSVVEADEFDRSFLQLNPDIACITSMDADHLDIYGTASDLEQAFIAFSKKVKSQGKLVVRYGLPLQGITFGMEQEADYSIGDITVEEGKYRFVIRMPKGMVEDVVFHKPGHHNLLNALAAFVMGVEAGFSPNKLAKALSSFKGVQRRFSYLIRKKDFVFIDDYAHHPTEIEAVYQAISEMHPDHSITVVFQPHLFSRTKDFAEDFATSLEKFDCVLLLEIYPARELPIPGITASWLLEKIRNPNKKVIAKADIAQEVRECATDILVTLGAGDIGLEVPKIKKELAYAS
ncbi:MAG: UDP-N-acetylmuramate--L-alanine ligase [Bacteroidota bacterium]